MKKTMFTRLSVFLPIALLAALPVSASVTVSVDAGLLRSNPTVNSGATLTDGNLLLLIASPSGTFLPAAPGGFVSGDNIIVGSGSLVSGAFAMNDLATGTPGETLNTLTFDYGIGSLNNSAPTADTAFVVGDKLALRWFDSFTLAQFLAPNNNTPTTGFYGTYTAPGTTTPDGGIPWVGPADGTTNTGPGLNFFTTDDPPGTQPPAFGVANTAVIALPEPSTFALLIAGFLIYAGFVMSKRQICKREK